MALTERGCGYSMQNWVADEFIYNGASYRCLMENIMKLLRYTIENTTRAGILDKNQQIRDVSALLPDITPDYLADYTRIEKLLSLDIQKFPLVIGTPKIEASISRPRKIICAGYNSRVHVEEMGLTLPAEDDIVFFLKSDNTINGPYDPVEISRYNKLVDWEGELALVIGKQCKDISEAEAGKYILGYSCFNDISDRYWQFETAGKQFSKGKCFDTFAPIGPYLVTPDEISDPWNLDVRLSVNGELRQSFNTSDYIFHAEKAISFFSRLFTLYPGDVIAFGSGPGNAAIWGGKYLKPGDEIEFSISELGTQKQKVIAI